MSSPSSNNVLIGRGILLFAKRVSGVLRGFLDLGNCDVFSLTPAAEFAELLNWRTGAATPYKRVAKRTKLDMKIAGYEFDASIIATMLLGTENDLTQTSGSVTGETLLTAAGAVGIKGLSVQTAFRNISAVTLKQGATTLILATDYEISDALGGVIRILPTSPSAVDGTAVTIDYTKAAITTAIKVVSPGVSSAVEGRLIFLPDPATGPELEHRYWNASIAPDGEQNFISEEFAKWGATVSLQNDAAGEFGGSATYPFGQIIQRA